METLDHQQQALDFLNATSTSITFKYKTFGKHFDGDTHGRHIFRVRIANKLGSYNFDFGQSIANRDETPTAYDVLVCIQKYDVGSFEDFCSEFGYEAYNENYTGANRTAKKIYNAVVKEWEAVDKLFSSKQIELLREIQ